MSNYLREDFSNNKAITVTEMKSKIKTYLSNKVDSPIESVQVAEGVEEAAANEISTWQDPSLFFVANNLYVNPTKVNDKTALATKLAPLLKTDVASLVPKFEIRKKRHLEIIRKMSVSTRDAVLKRINTEKAAIKNGQLLASESIITYIKIEDNLVRFYPERSIAGQITGFIDGE